MQQKKPIARIRRRETGALKLEMGKPLFIPLDAILFMLVIAALVAIDHFF